MPVSPEQCSTAAAIPLKFAATLPITRLPDKSERIHAYASLFSRRRGHDCCRRGGYCCGRAGDNKKIQALYIAGVMDSLKFQQTELVTHDIGNTVGYALA